MSSCLCKYTIQMMNACLDKDGFQRKYNTVLSCRCCGSDDKESPEAEVLPLLADQLLAFEDGINEDSFLGEWRHFERKKWQKMLNQHITTKTASSSSSNSSNNTNLKTRQVSVKTIAECILTLENNLLYSVFSCGDPERAREVWMRGVKSWRDFGRDDDLHVWCELLCELERNIKWESVSDDWQWRRPQWMQDLSHCCSVYDAKELMSELETHITDSSAQPSWSHKRDMWHGCLVNVTHVHEAARLLVELQESLVVSAFYNGQIPGWWLKEAAKLTKSECPTMPSTMAVDMLRALKNPDMSDVYFVVNDNKRISANRWFLMQRSEFFRALLQGGMKESQQAEIQLTDVEYEPFTLLLEYLYTDTLRLTGRDLTTVVDLLQLANRLLLASLREVCELYLVQAISVNNVVDMLVLVHELGDSLSLLKQNAMDFLNSHWKCVEESDIDKIPSQIMKEMIKLKDEMNNVDGVVLCGEWTLKGSRCRRPAVHCKDHRWLKHIKIDDGDSQQSDTSESINVTNNTNKLNHHKSQSHKTNCADMPRKRAKML